MEGYTPHLFSFSQIKTRLKNPLPLVAVKLPVLSTLLCCAIDDAFCVLWLCDAVLLPTLRACCVTVLLYAMRAQYISLGPKLYLEF